MRLKSLLIGLVACAPLMAQRVVDKVDRGLVAVPASSSGNFISWRVLGEEYYDVTYNLYANGSLIKSGLTVSNYTHSGGSASTTYQVAPVVRGVEGDKCDAVTRWAVDDNSNPYYGITVKPITARDGVTTDITSYYTINDISLGDVTGDGRTDFIVKRPCSLASDYTQSNFFHAIECYDWDGNRLWWIDMGPNMLSGADEQWDAVMYDWDQDGKAEVLLRGADNMIIYMADGTQYIVGDATVDTRYSGIEYTSTGNEYLLYLNGETGKPYQCITYPLARGSASDWGDSYGHRSTKHYFGAPYLDGRTPAIFLGRGCYTQHKFAAYTVNASDHSLTQLWTLNFASSGSWYGQGYHNFAIGDVDWDGRDEIIFGSMVIDDNGKGLSTTGLGHGDAQHCSDFDPYRHGAEQFACNEDSPNMNYRNATTSEIYYRSVGTSDDGRALMGNFTNDYPGSHGKSVNTGWVGSVTDKENGNLDLIDWSDLNQRLYWDGDLLDEYFDSPGSNRRQGVVYKAGTGSRLATFSPSNCNNSTKNNPCAIGDIIGDWREEVIMSCGDTYFGIFTTRTATTYRIPTLWSDHQYRNAMVWQSMGYNQPPHKSYFLGEMEGITVAPPPITMNDKTEVANGGTITTTDDHLIVCETNDTKVSIASNASPYMVTFNVPSWVQGTAPSNATSASYAINYTYYTCDVTGGPLTGSTRVVKQGDGILNLPKVDMTYTGETNVWAGTLNFDGTLKNSSLWLNRFAELNSDGGTFRSITADYASTIRPGGADNVGTITTDTLALGFGSRVVIDLDCSSGTASIDQINASLLTIEAKTTDVWLNYGPEYTTPVLEINATLADGDLVLPEGTYTLGTIGAISGDISNLKVEGVSGLKKSLAVTDGKLILTVEGMRDATTVYWTGDAGTDWDLASTMNFDNDGTEDYFVTGDNVVFDAAASSFTVNVADELEPASVTVKGDKAYTFKGSGELTGDMTLSKEGTGTLTINNDNSYTGQTSISGGTVVVSTLANENMAKGNLGAVSSSPILLSDGGAIQNTATVTLGTAIKTSGDDGGVINAGAAFNMNKAISGTLLTKKGSGTLTCYAANSSLTTLAIAAGSVASGYTPAKTIDFQGGAFYDNGQNTSHAINVDSGKSGTWYLSETYYTHYANKITGEGTLTIIPRNTVSRVSLKINAGSFYGTIKHTTSSIWLPLNTSTAMSHATLDIADGCTVTNTAQTLTIGAVTGKGSLAYPISNFSSQTTLTGTNTWKIGNSDGNDFTFAGTIYDNGSSSYAAAFNKVGTCKMTFTGSGSYCGNTIINAGELCMNNKGTQMLGTGTLTVKSGATLSGSGALANKSITINEGGVFRAGVSETSVAGVIDCGGNSVKVNGTIQTCIRTKSSRSYFTNIGILYLNGTLKITGNGSQALALGAEVTIFDNFSAINISDDLQLDLCYANVETGYQWDTSRLDEGILVVGDAPEAIKSLKDDDIQTADIYTLSGVKVSQPKRAGLYIVNGVKTLLK